MYFCAESAILHSCATSSLYKLNLTSNFGSASYQLSTPLPTVIVYCSLLPSVSAGACLLLGKCVLYSSTSSSKLPKKKAKAVS